MSDTRSVEPDPLMIGGVPKAAFVHLPEPASLFARRAARARLLSASGELAPYLVFLTAVADAQSAILADAPEPSLPAPDLLERARRFAMPPLDRAAVAPDAALRETCRCLFERLAPLKKPTTAEAALGRIRGADDDALDGIIAGVLADAAPAEAAAEHVYAAAALQVWFSRTAARIDATTLVPVSTGVCPVCGGPPVCSLIAGWYGAEGVRYASCSLCATLWNEVRVKCLACGSTKGVGYQEIEGESGTIKAETCDACCSYLKVLYQDEETGLDPVVDDVGSLALDQLLRDTPYRRVGVNPFLMGY